MVLDQQFDGHQPDSDTDGGVRNIEGRPMEWGMVKLEEINHFSVEKAVDQIPNRTGQNEWKGEGKVFFIFPCPSKEEKKGTEGNEWNTHEEDRSSSSPAKDSKSAARVSHVGKIEEAGDHFYPGIKRQILLNRKFCVLVQREDQKTSDQKNPILSFH